MSKRFEALYAKEAALPGPPYPEVDPGLARELGHDAAEMLEARAQAVDLLVSAGLAVTPVGVARTAVGVVGKAAAKGLGQATGLAAGAVGAGLASEEAVRQAYRAEIEALGFDPPGLHPPGASTPRGFNPPGLHPGDPNALEKLPPVARSRIANAGAVALSANGASTVMAREIARALTGPAVSELERALMEDGVSTASKKIAEAFQLNCTPAQNC